jgi:hypothetical protein
MNERIPVDDPEVLRRLVRELHRVARRESELADLEAAAVPYWRPCPVTVLAHRAAAQAIYQQAAALDRG